MSKCKLKKNKKIKKNKIGVVIGHIVLPQWKWLETKMIDCNLPPLSIQQLFFSKKKKKVFNRYNVPLTIINLKGHHGEFSVGSNTT
jgi:hypothetical protein